jgi:hypothetical protein
MPMQDPNALELTPQSHVRKDWASLLSRSTVVFYFFFFSLKVYSVSASMISGPTLSFSYRAQLYYLHQNPY